MKHDELCITTWSQPPFKLRVALAAAQVPKPMNTRSSSKPMNSSFTILNPVFKMMNFGLRMKDSALTMMIFALKKVLKMMNFLLKITNRPDAVLRWERTVFTGSIGH